MVFPDLRFCFRGSALILLLSVSGLSNAYQPTMAFAENLAIPFNFDDAGNFHNGNAVVMIAQRGKVTMALIDTAGNQLFTADEIADFGPAEKTMIRPMLGESPISVVMSRLSGRTTSGALLTVVVTWCWPQSMPGCTCLPGILRLSLKRVSGAT